MNTRLILAISAVLLVAFIFFSYQATNKPVKVDFPDVAKISKVATDSATIADHTKGSGARVLTEYADLQCPACKSFHEFLKNESKKDPAFAKILNEKYTLVYRSFPLVTIHKNAQAAAQAAEAAGLQGKFFEFVDVAYAQQDQWKDSDTATAQFQDMARDLELDLELFKKDSDADVVKKKVASDIQSGIKAELESTPTFYIDGKKIIDFATFEDFKKILIDRSK